MGLKTISHFMLSKLWPNYSKFHKKTRFLVLLNKYSIRKFGGHTVASRVTNFKLQCGEKSLVSHLQS